jgi:hypothetical protein
MRILRNNSASAQTGANATIDSFVAPSYGWTVVPILMTLTQAGTLEIYQRLRSNSSWSLTDQFILPAAGIVRTSVQITGEQVRALFTNGGVAQTPELLIAMA